MPDANHYTYFIQNHRSKLIKIGRTRDLFKRFRELQMHTGDFLVLLLHCVADRDFEADLHKRFAHLRQFGEWFRPDPDLLESIETVKAIMGPERVEEMDRLKRASILAWQFEKGFTAEGTFYGATMGPHP